MISHLDKLRGNHDPSKIIIQQKQFHITQIHPEYYLCVNFLTLGGEWYGAVSQLQYRALSVRNLYIKFKKQEQHLEFIIKTKSRTQNQKQQTGIKNKSSL